MDNVLVDLQNAVRVVLALYRGASEICGSSEIIGLRMAFLVGHSFMVTARVYYRKKRQLYTRRTYRHRFNT